MAASELDILVVEDDSGICEILKSTFEERKWTVATVASVSEARDWLLRSSFKVVLSDQYLPDGTGVDLLVELPSLGTNAIPILMTGMVETRVVMEAINRGRVYRFVPKPLDLPMLIQTIDRAIHYHAVQCERARFAHDVLAHNELLRRDAQLRARNIEEASNAIRHRDAEVEHQRHQIEQLYAEIQQAYLHTVTSLTAAIEAKDRYTKGHSERVNYYCTLMADVLGLSEESRNDLRIASVLHDLGKIGIPDSILAKPGQLTEEEHQVIATHTSLTENILKPLPYLARVRQIIAEHHERFDGTGYPQGLKGDQISLEGRILAVADAYDAMRSNRPYRKAIEASDAVKELQSGAGKQFCPLAVGALMIGLATRGEFSNSKCQTRSGEVRDHDSPCKSRGTKPTSHSRRKHSIINKLHTGSSGNPRSSRLTRT